MFSRIMVATDGSDNAKAAVAHAAELAKKVSAAEVLLVHICPGCTADIDVKDTNRETAETIVHEAAKEFRGSGAKVHTRVEIDYPPEAIGTAIVAVAEKEGVDLLVLGSRGLSEFRGMLLGSVSYRVVQKATCPVLIIKHSPRE
ncbi:MAG: universal stress protein [Thermoleophilia bacterium]